MGTGAAAGALALGKPFRARAADRVEITFASAKFFGKQTLAEVVEAYNQAQSKVHVTYVELPPPSSSTEVHQALVQQLARRTGTPDVFTQDVVWIAEFAGAGWALPLDEYYRRECAEGVFPRHDRRLHLPGQADGPAVVRRFRHALLPQGSARRHRRQGARDLGRPRRPRRRRSRSPARRISASCGRASRPRCWSATWSRSSPPTAAAILAPDGKIGTARTTPRRSKRCSSCTTPSTRPRSAPPTC